MNFSDRPPSSQWAALKHRGEKLAEVWFKPEGDPLALTFRVPRASFQLPGQGHFLAAEILLRSVGIAAEEVESWGHEGPSQSGVGRPISELGSPLEAPSEGADHLTIHVWLKTPAPDAAPGAGDGDDVPEARWQALESRYDAVLRLEAGLDTLRISMESLQREMEAASRKSLSADEKVNALNADVALWTKLKSRLTHALPKAKDFIHRATWAVGAPERKRLEGIFKSHIQPRVPFAETNRVLEEIENLLKDRQVLSSHGTAAYQECKNVLAEVQGALRTLLANSRSNAVKKRGENSTGGKLF